MCDANPDDACETVCSPDNGSGGSTGGGAVDTSTALPDFSLPDVNPASPLAGQQVSPREYIRQMSVWYFGHST